MRAAGLLLARGKGGRVRGGKGSNREAGMKEGKVMKEGKGRVQGGGGAAGVARAGRSPAGLSHAGRRAPLLTDAGIALRLLRDAGSCLSGDDISMLEDIAEGKEPEEARDGGWLRRADAREWWENLKEELRGYREG